MRWSACRTVLLLVGLCGCGVAPTPDESPDRRFEGTPAGSGGHSAPGGAESGNATQEQGGNDSHAGGGRGGVAGAGVGGVAGGGETGAVGGAGNAAAGQETGGVTDGGTMNGGSAAGGGVGGTAAEDPAQLPPVTLHLAGDSTVMTYPAGSLQEGWGQELPQFLLAKVTINNQALGGSSVQTFYSGRWKNIMGSLRAGDYVAAAFGANDSGTVAGRHVDPPDFKAMYARMSEEVMAKQATFIIVTPSALQQWSGGVEGNQRLAPYVSVLHSLAAESGNTLVDLNARSLELLNQIGQEAAKQIYIDGDKAHFTKKGATQMASLVAQELKRGAGSFGAYVK